MALEYGGAMDLMNPAGNSNPLDLFNMLATNPEAIIPQLAAAGIPPPGGQQVAGDVWPPPLAYDFNQRFQGGQDTPPPPVPLPQPRPAEADIAPPNPLDQPAGFYGLPKPGFNAPGPTGTPEPGAPTDVRSNQQKAGDAGSTANLMRALSGIRPPPAPAIQKLDSPRIPQAHAIPAQSQIAGLLTQILGQPVAKPPLYLGQAIK